MLTEGKYKTNIKSLPLECADCGYHASGDAFEFGILWWANKHCPECKSRNLNYYTKRASPPPPPKKKKK